MKKPKKPSSKAEQVDLPGFRSKNRILSSDESTAPSTGSITGPRIGLDVTKGEMAETRLIRLNRLYATLSKLNQTFAKATDREALFQETCRLAVEQGRFRFAWIGLIHPISDHVIPAAFAGEEQGYLVGLKIEYLDPQLGAGPTGTAIREERCYLCQDIATDPHMAPWRERALQRGYRASAAVPFRQNGKVIGALTVYAGETQTFEAEEEALLVEIGQAISTALDSLLQQTQLRAELEARKLMEKDLRFQHLILSTQQETSLDGILIVDSNGQIVSYNRKYLEMWGIPKDLVDTGSSEKTLGWAVEQVADPETFGRKIKEIYARPDTKSNDEILLKDGRTFERYSAPMIDRDGKNFGRVWYFRDITAVKKAGEALRLSEARFRGLIENSHDIITLMDREGHRIYEGPSVQRVLGYKPGERAGTTFDNYPPEDVLLSHPAFQVALANPGKPIYAELKAIRKDGTPIDCEIYVTNWLDNPAVQGIVVNGRDVTSRKQAEEERKSLEDQLRVSQKMEAIGRLAGGIAHDFNNLLVVIMGYTEMMLKETQLGDPNQENLTEVMKAAKRAAALTKQILAFGRKQVLRPVPLDLNLVIADFQTMLRQVLGAEIELEMKLAMDLSQVLADPSQIEQVLMNLVVNARDAMPKGGKLTLSTSNLENNTENAAEHPAMGFGAWVMLSVTDTGMGMDEKVKAKIFEPFFTTKDVGQGTGLGLSTVYGIVKQSGGSIAVESEPEKGTTFKIYLPRIGAAVPKAPEKERPGKFSFGTETILLAEDEASIRNILKTILENDGYKVLTAGDGVEAIELCKRYKEEIHLLLTDVAMPKMSGKALTQELAKIQPRAKVLFMSGYSGTELTSKGVLGEGIHYIGKPFTFEDLAAKVREVLDEK
jgi:PAS domain S-box-containing protein